MTQEQFYQAYSRVADDFKSRDLKVYLPWPRFMYQVFVELTKELDKEKSTDT